MAESRLGHLALYGDDGVETVSVAYARGTFRPHRTGHAATIYHILSVLKDNSASKGYSAIV